jgi:hypothetical protein
MKLYFARLHELGDPWEGGRSASDKIVSLDPEYVPLAIQGFNRLALVSCWHENERESVAMWRLYVSGREGVAIKTTVGRLARVLSAGRELKIGRVVYRDINPPDDAGVFATVFDGASNRWGEILNVERPLFRKNRGYEHEREVRAVIYDPHYCANAALAAAAHPDHLLALSLGRVVSDGQATPGEAVPVDLSLLIERIVVSPGFPKWAIGSLQKAVNAAGIHVRVESSGLLNRPGEGVVGTSDR